jgi:OOP family OmpA-OmpF porin
MPARSPRASPRKARLPFTVFNFDTGKALVKPESKAQLEPMATLLKTHADYNVYIVGHTDNVGAFESNLALSRQRAEAVREALVRDYQIAAARMTPYGVASVAPVASNAQEAGRARNRRIELVLH